MINKKKLILVTGTTCSGKTTLLKSVKQSSPERVMIIPQITNRTLRSDDDSDCIIHRKNINPDYLFLYNNELTLGNSTP